MLTVPWQAHNKLLLSSSLLLLYPCRILPPKPDSLQEEAFGGHERFMILIVVMVSQEYFQTHQIVYIEFVQFLKNINYISKKPPRKHGAGMHGNIDGAAVTFVSIRN